MSNYYPGGEVSTDRREETVSKQQPGYMATEQVTTDVAAERRQGMFQFTGFILTVLGVLEILLGLRFVLKLIAANPNTGFTQFIYGASALFVGPFRALVQNPSAEGMVLEVTTLIAMAVYALLFWIVLRFIPLVVERPSARSVSRSVSEQSPDRGNSVTTERTSRTTVR